MADGDKERELEYVYDDELPEERGYDTAERWSSVILSGVFKGVALFLMQLTGDTMSTSGGKMITEKLKGAEETTVQYAQSAIRAIGPYVSEYDPLQYLPSPRLLGEYVPEGIMKPLSTLYDYTSTSMFMIMPSFMSSYFGLGRESFAHIRNVRDAMVVDPENKKVETEVSNLLTFVASVATTAIITRAIQTAIVLML